jgi:hypothetical protein
LAAITINCDISIGKRLKNKIADHPAVIGVHPWSIGVKNSHYFDIQPVLAVIIKKKRLCAPLALVVTRPYPGTIHIPQYASVYEDA